MNLPSAPLPSLFDLHGRVAVITGGAGLLGEEFCRTLAEAGAAVVVADIQATAAEKLAAEIRAQVAGNASWPAAIGVGVDVTEPASVQRMVALALETYGRLDILVNNAALDPKVAPSGEIASAVDSFEAFPLEAWNQALAVNLTGAFLCCQAAVRPMLAQGKGVIINLSSIYGLVGPDQRIYQRHKDEAQSGGAGADESAPRQYKPVYYSVSKAGILGLTQYLATYYAGRNIRVNALTPGGVYNQQDPAFVQAYSQRAVLGRMAQKDELNGALLFLASDASAYMTGANLIIDGGWTAW